MMFNYAAVCIIKFRVTVIRLLTRRLAGGSRSFGDTKFNCHTAGQLNIMSPKSSVLPVCNPQQTLAKDIIF